MQKSYLSTVVSTVEYLVTTAAVGSQPSSNLALLSTLFEKQRNTDAFLTGSSLFEWAKSEPWTDQCTNPRPDVQADIETDSESIELPNEGSSHSGLSHVFVNIVNGSEIVQSAVSSDTQQDAEVEAEMEVDDNPGSRVTLRNEKAREPNWSDQMFATFVLAPDLNDSGPSSNSVSDNTAPSASTHNASTTSAIPPHMSSTFDRQLSAKLHCLYGMPIDSIRKDSTARYDLRSETRPIHPYARSKVYDLRQHSDHTLWGPFTDDGSQNVDWEKIEAIMIILHHNMRISAEAHNVYESVLNLPSRPFTGVTPNSFVSTTQSVPMEPALPLEAKDPYHVTGTWMRVVCFLDYTDLYDFNFDNGEVEPDRPRGPIFKQEAVRLIVMKLRITKIQPPGEEDGQRLPVVHFKGTSSSLRPTWDPNAHSKIKGKFLTFSIRQIKS